MRYALLKTESKELDIREVDNLNDVSILNEAVGRYIEVLSIAQIIQNCPTELHNVLIVVDEEGKLKNKAKNINIGYDVLVGDICFVGTDAPDMIGLTDKQIQLLESFVMHIK